MKESKIIRTPPNHRIMSANLDVWMALTAAAMMRRPSYSRSMPANVDALMATRGPQRNRTLNAGGLQAFSSSRPPAFKLNAGGLQAFSSSGLQGRAWIGFERIKNNSYSTKPSNYVSKIGRRDGLDSRGIDEKTIILRRRRRSYSCEATICWITIERL